jgi:parvulin-like peptidyl-prolyl isomerase
LLLLCAAAREEVVARVDGVTITSGAVAGALATFRTQGANPDGDEILRALVDQALLAAEAERLGLRSAPEVQRRLEDEARRAAAEAFIEKELAATIVPQESQLRELFHATADHARFQLLSFATREDAAAALRRIEKGASFVDEARRAVTARVYPAPADVPPVLRAQMDLELATAVFGAGASRLAGPFAFSAGWALVEILEKSVGDEAAFSARRAAIAEHARRQLASEAKAHLAKQLRAKAGVVLDEPFLRALEGARATPQDLAHPIATIDGREIRYAEIHPTIRALGGPGGDGHLASAAVKIQLAWQLIDARLVQDLASSRGYSRTPEVIARIAGAERAILAGAAADQIRSAAPAPSEDEIAAFYDRNAPLIGAPFEQALPSVAAAAAEEKRAAAVTRRVQELRKKASIKTDGKALRRATSGQP